MTLYAHLSSADSVPESTCSSRPSPSSASHSDPSAPRPSEHTHTWKHFVGTLQGNTVSLHFHNMLKRTQTQRPGVMEDKRQKTQTQGRGKHTARSQLLPQRDSVLPAALTCLRAKLPSVRTTCLFSLGSLWLLNRAKNCFPLMPV